MATRIIWKHRQAMVEKAARMMFYDTAILDSWLFNGESLYSWEWFNEHLPAYAAFQTGDVEPTNRANMQKAFWRDVKKLADKAADDYYALPEVERKVFADRIKREMEPAPTSQPGSVKLLSAVMVVDVAELPTPASPAETSGNGEIKRFIDNVSKPISIFLNDPYAEAAAQRRAEYRQRRLWQEYETGKLEAEDFYPASRPPEPTPAAQSHGVKSYGFHHLSGFRSSTGFGR